MDEGKNNASSYCSLCHFGGHCDLRAAHEVVWFKKYCFKMELNILNLSRYGIFKILNPPESPKHTRQGLQDTR